MARPHDRKRQRADDPSQHHPPSKRAKSNGLSYSVPNFSPEFYDNLSKIHLTSRALRELDRRNDQYLQQKPPPSQGRIADFSQVLRKGGPQLARFARGGGPDLLDLRGYQDSITITHAMASASSSATSRRTQSTKATTVSSKRSSAYDANFEQHLINHNIFPPFHDFPDDRIPPEPANLDEILRVLKVPRGSLSPSIIPKSAFKDFQRKNTTKSEGTVMRNVVPILAGGLNIPNEGHLPFVNLLSLTENTIVNPVPDFFDGAHPGAVDKRIKKDLNNIIIPTKHANVPIATNFFLEAKGPGGSGDVAKAQAALNGAYGARMMHTLQNYLEKEPVYDGNAYTFTSTLLDGTLKLYAHHITTPISPGERPDYHITQLKAYALTGDSEVWLEGTGAFRNLRKLAKEYRDRFIAMANARARDRNADAAATETDDITTIEEERREGSSSPLDFFDCQMFAKPEIEQETQEIQDAGPGLGILHHTEIGERQPKLPRSPPSPSSTRVSKKRGPAQV